MLALSNPNAEAYSVLSHEEVVDSLLGHHSASPASTLSAVHAGRSEDRTCVRLWRISYSGHLAITRLAVMNSRNLCTTFALGICRSTHSLYSSNVNEYAFALGALAHYVGDSWGHPAVNDSVPIEYPKPKRKFGKVVTYEDNPEAHLKTEFSFDVVQVAKGRYSAKQYHDFIGFEIAQNLLQRAFQETYGIALSEFLHNEELSIGTFRFAVSQVIPEMTKVALASRDHHHLEEKHDTARSEFLFHISRADYEKQFGSEYQRPGFFARFLAFLFKLIPKIGPLKAIQYKDPTPRTEDLYFKSMDNVVRIYQEEVHQVEAGVHDLPDRNLDTGNLTEPGKYELADNAYSQLLILLAKHNFAGVTPGLRENILWYFSTSDASISLKGKQWKNTEEALQLLKTANTPLPANPRAALFPGSEERDAASGGHFIPAERH